jgi:spore coat protein A, manganese oxidase
MAFLRRLDMITRRELLMAGALAGGAVLLPVGPLVELVRGSEPTTPPTVPFLKPLQIPPLLKGDTDITMRVGAAQILQNGPATPIWGYSGRLPGPTITAFAGSTRIVTQRNELPVSATVHQHGQVADGDSDGHPDDLIPPKGSKVYAYPNRTTGVSSQMTARTMWYHDHAQDVTGRNVLNGLAGFYLVRDPNDPADNFINFEDPKNPDLDVALVLQDRIINKDGTLYYPGPIEADDTGFLGDVVLVNGDIQPRFPVRRRKYRFRILNGSNGRQYRLTTSPAVPMTEIATEGGFIAQPLPLKSLFIAQAERYEVVLDFTDAPDQVVLQNVNNDADRPRLRNLLRFDVAATREASDPIPSPLRTIEQIPAASATVRRRFVFDRSDGQFEINDRGFNPSRIDASPRAGTTEIWTLINDGGGWVHPIHIHLINFQILDRNGRPPAPQDVGFKETVYLPPDGSARVIMRWPDVPPVAPGATTPLPGPNPPGTFRDRYVFHCHNLEHEDHTMMGQFRVLPAA